jgi:hypothetical protein
MSHNSAGDYVAAQNAANQARTWCLVAFLLGFIPWLAGIFFFILPALGAAAAAAG